MAMAVQALYPGTEVTIGPVIEDGFFYDFAPKTPFTVDDLPKIEAKMKEFAKADLRVYRTVVPKAEAIEKFRALGEKYKVEIIEGIPDDTVSIYSQGDWMDLCRGPHVPSTGYIKAFKLTSVAGAYWRGDEHNAMLSRIYGTSFPNKDALEEHLKMVELAKQRDHRKLGREMGLFFFDPISPGSPFFLPRGATIYNELVALRAPVVRSLRIHRSDLAADFPQRAVQHLGTLGIFPREHVPDPRPRKRSGQCRRHQSRRMARRLRRQADELPGAPHHVSRRRSARIATCRFASRILAGSIATSARARCTDWIGCARWCRTTRMSTAPRTRSNPRST